MARILIVDYENDAEGYPYKGWIRDCRRGC